MSLRIVAASLLLPQASSVSLLSCVYGFSQCLGLKSGEGYEKAKELGCPVSDDGESWNGALASTFNTAFGQPSALEGSKSTDYQDGMPCTFSPDSQDEDLATLQLSEIEIKMSDGTSRNPTGATWAPSNERNEMRTLLLVGHFGFSENLKIVSVSVRGSSYSGGGLSYTNMGHELAYAKWWDVDSHAKLEGDGNWLTDRMRGPTNCAHTFPDTTHLIQVVFNGGVTVTFNGNTKLAYNLDQEKHKQMFKVILGDDMELAADKFLGLADEADGDNYVDVCMKLTDEDVNKFVDEQKGAMIRVISTRECDFMVLPKGDCLNDLVNADCGDCATESQEICITEIPNAAYSCDPKAPAGRHQPYSVTESDISALKDCKLISPGVNSSAEKMASSCVTFTLSISWLFSALSVSMRNLHS
mmetsp:Transcript_102351/g.265107  ORF Transcript_102351/g.265107 Transcript_102351/m.265107 type:complete len:414 (-) Transcript_102351:176-1417(-)